MIKTEVFQSCLSPVRIWNRNTRSFEYVACGKCVSCRNRSGSVFADRVEREFRQHRYSYFFTLTYDNEHLPLVRQYTDKNGHVQFRPDSRLDSMVRKWPYMPFVDKADRNIEEFDGVLPTVENMFARDCFGVLSREDCKLFFKRLRINIDRRFKKFKSHEDFRIRYVLTGEYGPNTFRPHYHGILWYDSPLLHSEILSLIRQSWGRKERVSGGVNRFSFVPFCSPHRFTDAGSHPTCGLVSGNAGRYVAQYVSGSSDLPQVLQLPQFRPFRLCSKSPTVGYWQGAKEEVFRHVADRYDGRCLVRHASDAVERVTEVWNPESQCFEVRSFPYPKDILDSLWCKCREYNDCTYSKKFLLYSFAYRHRRDFAELRLVSPTPSGFDQVKLSPWESLKLFYPEEYEYLEMDCPQNRLAAVKCLRACFELHITPKRYLQVFDYYLRMLQLYKLERFYRLQEDYCRRYGCLSVIGSYPFVLELEEVYDHDKCKFQLNWFRQFGLRKRDFYPDGLHLDFDFVSSLREENQLYYRSYRSEQIERDFLNNKSKRKNNSCSKYRVID